MILSDRLLAIILARSSPDNKDGMLSTDSVTCGSALSRINTKCQWLRRGEEQLGLIVDSVKGCVERRIVGSMTNVPRTVSLIPLRDTGSHSNIFCLNISQALL